MGLLLLAHAFDYALFATTGRFFPCTVSGRRPRWVSPGGVDGLRVGDNPSRILVSTYPACFLIVPIWRKSRGHFRCEVRKSPPGQGQKASYPNRLFMVWSMESAMRSFRHSRKHGRIIHHENLVESTTSFLTCRDRARCDSGLRIYTGDAGRPGQCAGTIGHGNP